MNIQSWSSEINRNRLCSNYRIFKSAWDQERYLVTLDPAERINLSKFRCGSSRLPGVINRSLPEGGRTKCPKCNLDEVGDEFHYVLVCPALKAPRGKYLNKYYFTRPNTMKMAELFNSGSCKQLVNLAKFVCEIM